MAVGGGGLGIRATIAAVFKSVGAEKVIADINRQAGSTERLEKSNKRAAQSGNELARSFRTILLRTVGIVGVLRAIDAIQSGFRSLIDTGFEYSSTIETATLSIAGLITSTADLVDVNGNVLEGAEALNAAYALAEDQIRKLRIAGIQTAATTQELVDAFQQAVGVGLRFGLSLDEARKITVRIAQAAGALSVPYGQLNEEIRSLLSGTIDARNTRIATALGITNEDIARAKEANNLAGFILERFEDFGTTADRLLNTWAAVRSTIQETAEILASTVTRPLFEGFRDAANANLQRVFDFDTAEISEEFSALANAVQLFFANMGSVAARTIGAVVDLMAELNTNAQEIGEWMFSVSTSLSRIVQQVARWFATLAGVVLRFQTVGGEMYTLEQSLETIADVMEAINDSALLWSATLVGVVGLVGAFLTTFAGAAAPWIGAAVAVGLLANAIDTLVTTEKERYQQARKQLQVDMQQTRAYIDQTEAMSGLIREYNAQERALANLEKGTEEYNQAHARMVNALETGVMQMGLTELFNEAAHAQGGLVEVLKEEIKQRRINVGLSLIETENRLGLLRIIQAEVEAERELNRERRRFGNDPQDRVTGEERARVQLIQDMEIQVANLRREIFELNQVLGSEDVEVVSPEQLQEGEDAIKGFRSTMALELARIKAELSRAEAELKIAYDQNLISARAYYTRLIEARTTAIDAEIELQRRLMDLQTEQADRTQTQANIVELESKREIMQLEAKAKLREDELKLAEEVSKATQRLYELTGREGEAAIMKVREQYDQLLQRLRADGDVEGQWIVMRLIDAEAARAEFQKLERIVEESQDRLSRRLSEIRTLEQIGAIGQVEAERQTAAAYRESERVLASLEQQLRAVIATGTDPELVNQAEEWLDLLKRQRLEIEGLTNEWLRFARDVEQAAIDALAQGLEYAVFQAESLTDAIRNLGQTFAAEIARITARMIALKVITASFDLFGLGVPTFSEGGAVQAATGGLIRGPGTGTSDSIPALVSNGEYVVRAEAVKRVGVEFMHRINQGDVPRALRSFRDGGQVGGQPPMAGPGRMGRGAPTSAELRGTLGVMLEDGLIAQRMDSPRGDRVVMKILGRNSRALRRIVGTG